MYLVIITIYLSSFNYQQYMLFLNNSEIIDKIFSSCFFSLKLWALAYVTKKKLDIFFRDQGGKKCINTQLLRASILTLDIQEFTNSFEKVSSIE